MYPSVTLNLLNLRITADFDILAILAYNSSMLAEHAHNTWREQISSLPVIGNLSKLMGIGRERYIDPKLSVYQEGPKRGPFWRRKGLYVVMRKLDNGYKESVGAGYFSNSKKAREHFSKRP